MPLYETFGWLFRRDAFFAGAGFLSAINRARSIRCRRQATKSGFEAEARPFLEALPLERSSLCYASVYSCHRGSPT
jgi:hypothetical protein